MRRNIQIRRLRIQIIHPKRLLQPRLTRLSPLFVVKMRTSSEEGGGKGNGASRAKRCNGTEKIHVACRVIMGRWANTNE
jgi:hypothetical protein